MEVPPPSSQTQPPIYYRPKPTPRPTPRATPPPVEPYEQEEPTPESAPPPPPIESTPAPTPAPESFQMQQPVLPAIFRGCWQGNVQFLDSIERLPGAAK